MNRLVISLLVLVFGETYENAIDSGMNEIFGHMEDFITPNAESGAKVARWDPNDLVNPEELGSYAEGDIVLARGRNGMKADSSKWKNGVVPYRITDDFNYKDYNTIMAAMEEYHKLTCVKWVRWSGEDDYVYFKSGNTGCWSSVGRTGGMQELNLQSPGCLTKTGTVIHEMCHALGFLHEQNRHERDNHVSINWYNIQNGRENNFQKATSATTDSYGVSYDYRSVMHYSANAFSKNGQPTITPKINGVELGQREGLSRGDVKKINQMYHCKKGAEAGRKKLFWDDTESM